MKPIFLSFLLSSLLAGATWAAITVGEDCTDADAPPGETLPQGPLFTMGVPASVDFDFTTGAPGNLCNPAEAGPDSVICFTPSMGCFVFGLTCAASDATAMTMKILSVGGPPACNETSPTCVSNGSGTNSVNANFVLNGGENYCFVCNADSGSTADHMWNLSPLGDCGTVPVELQSYSVENGD